MEKKYAGESTIASLIEVSKNTFEYTDDVITNAEIDEICGGATATISDYVRAEAEAVARIVNRHQSNDSIVFPFLSDAHCGYYSDTTNEATKLAGQLLELIGKRVPFDFIANGGDLSTGAWNSTRDSAFTDVEDYTELTREAHKGVPAVWAIGNHDDAPYQATADRLTQKETFALFGRKSRMSGAVCPNGCNYGYLDLDNRRLRVIYLDTDDKRGWGTVRVTNTNGLTCNFVSASNIGDIQLRWLAESALNFSNKDDPAAWSIVVISHAALNLDCGYTDPVSGMTYAANTENAAVILGAYRSGKNGSITHNGATVAYDFTANANRAIVIGAVHGHDHKFCSEMLTGDIVSVGCPNVMNGRERESDDGNTYAKTAGTADGTSFCILTIDRENCLIYADCVGAGYDRTFEYATEVVAYTNQIPISTDTDGSVFNGVGYQEGYRLGSSGTLSTQAGSFVTGFIPYKYGDIVYLQNVTIQQGITSGLTSTNQRIAFYDSSKAHIGQGNATGATGVLGAVVDSNGIITQFTTKANTANSIPGIENVAYFRLNGSYIGADSIITVNEVIV